ncbi:MAG: 4-hydroxybenzoate octaprenyltransferase [Alphaproteobacteria bacterium]|nr:4-hydroxybenzoate octaprenyltransferase [Alphaproteobacteria bacterium]MBV9061730.1 4-hydroxybenzoate octaprenyltransferase [Alphaproteobacteria bacterium]
MLEETQAIPADAIPRGWVDRAPARIQPYLRLARLDRPIGTWLLFWPCVFGLALGAAAQRHAFLSTVRDWWLLALFGIGAVVMRGAGCTYNDILDRNIDAQVARTRARPIPSGAVTVKQAWMFALAQGAAGLAILLSLNVYAIALGGLSLIFIALYPIMKRITWWPQAWLGLTFNWGALLGFAAQTGRTSAADLVLYSGCVFWTLGYDTIYALQDVDDDALVGVKSTARLFGTDARAWILLFYLFAFGLIAAAGDYGFRKAAAAALLLPVLGHFLWQLRRLDLESPPICLRLFRSNREAGGLIALAYGIASWISHAAGSAI